ncbi:hypothetical protein [Micromonospora sp. NPDC005652]|uniref:hypothetical protein n=1 Tax=Micromonospora sp. NPDC005652 TaxID=3157046 RepID=UPI00340D3494
MSSKNPKAKRLAATYRLRYTEAVGVMRQDSDLAEQMTDDLNISIAEAKRRIEGQYAEARRRADEDGVSFRTALANLRSGQALQNQFAGLAASLPSVEDLLRQELVLVCDRLVDEPVHRDGVDNFEVHGLNFDDVHMPHYVDEIEIEEAIPDLDSLNWDEAEELDGTTYLGTVRVHADISFTGFMHRGEAYSHEGEITILQADWNERTSRVSFQRSVILEFEARVEIGAESVELEFVSAITDEHAVGDAA